MLSLKEFEKFPMDEICFRTNEMSKIPFHYTPAVMAEHGYGFTWASMKSVAESCGLVSGYYDPNQTGVRVVSAGDDGVEIVLKSQDAYTRRSFTIEKETAEKLGEVLNAMAGSYNKGALMTAVVECGLAVMQNAKKQGRLTIAAKTIENSFNF